MIRRLATLLLSTALAAQSTANKTWTVTQVAGPVGFPGYKLLLAIGDEQLRFSIGHRDPILSIAFTQVTRVVYSPVRFSRDQQLLGSRYGNGTQSIPTVAGCGSPGCGGAAALFVVAWAISGRMHGSGHYLIISWMDRSVEQQIMFEASKSDRALLAAQLREIAGNRWVDVETQRNKLESLIQKRSRDALALRLDLDSLCGTYALAKGDYRVLIVGLGGEADVYFFAQDVSFSQLRGIAHAQIGESAEDRGLQYAPDSTRIISIPWQGKSLTFVQAD